MITIIVILSITAAAVLLLLLGGQPRIEWAYAQAQPQGTNFTQLFSTDEEFQACYEGECFQVIDVLYHDPTLLVLQSDYVDVIWKGVARAQKEGYQIDAITSYAISSLTGRGSNVNLLVAMSK
jgi:hypothetical protein